MAILKDTLIQGNARVTDTLYANTVSTDILSADNLATKKLDVTYTVNNAANNTQGINLKYNITDMGLIGSNGVGWLGIYATGSVIIRPNSTLDTSTNLWSTTTGITLDSTTITPSGSISLGTSSAKWSDLYASAATLNELNVVGGDTVITTASGHGATPKLIFQRGTATDQYSNWKLYNDSAGVLTLQVYHSALTGDTDIVEILPPTSGGQIPAIRPGTTNSYDLGTSSLVWRNIYATTFNGALSGNATTATNLAGTATAGYVYAGPASGSAAAPSFRALAASDIPSLNYLPLTGGTVTGNVNATSFTIDSAVTLTYNSIDLSLNFNFS